MDAIARYVLVRFRSFQLLHATNLHHHLERYLANQSLELARYLILRYEVSSVPIPVSPKQVSDAFSIISRKSPDMLLCYRVIFIISHSYTHNLYTFSTTLF